LLRMYSYTNNQSFYEKAENTLEAFAGIIDHFGIFAGTYGLALAWYSRPYTQVIVIGNDSAADALYRAALRPYSANKSVLCLADGHAVAQNLPPALAETIPNVPGANDGKGIAVLCSGFTCRPQVSEPAALEKQLHDALNHHRAQPLIESA